MYSKSNTHTLLDLDEREGQLLRDILETAGDTDKELGREWERFRNDLLLALPKT